MTSVPPQMRAALTFLAGGSAIGLLFSFDRRLGLIALAGIFTLGCLLAFYKRILGWIGKRKSAEMSGQIKEHATAAPNSINDPAKRARLDDLTRSFDAGLQKFRTSGKDVYKLPWYLIVGEPGSGKTEAVRHCNVGFPPGLQDELQGTGGTINMNWWFTNHAVLLDTAGRLMFEEVKPGETSEWREFLQLLHRNRPNCPINGLLLVIPAESLIRDTTESISKKAGKIAQQLDLIQRTLDVRFPVFVLVTKCDLLSGFREFFEGLNDPQSQHQMIGWSNPEPRDAPFQANRVTEYLETVVERVGKRRLGLLRDPVPEKEGGKRADEVDALYGLPQSLSLIGPRLRSYLESIFVAGEWSAKPLFLRGIYFTSAMREGAALDQELAEALGVSLDDLPEGRAWERERAYFLRDMFMDKAFRERGLVTRATNTNQLLRRRRIFLFGAGSLAFLALLGISILGYVSLKESVGQQSHFWNEAKQNWNDGIWHPIVARDAAGHYQYKGDQPVSETEPMPLVQYHDKIRELCDKEIEVGWAFRPMARFTRLEGDRKKAQRILFEGGIISPLVKESRRVMMDPAAAPGTGDSNSLVHQAEALAALIGIESDTVSHHTNVEALSESLLAPLIRFTTGQEKPADAGNFRSLANTLLWTYTKNPNGQWPPPWLSAGTSLATNKPIAAGLERLLTQANFSMQGQEAGLAEVRRIRDLLRAFRQKEADLNATAVSTESREQVYARANTQETELGEIKQSLDQALKDAQAKNLVAGERFTVGRAYEVLVGGSQSQSRTAFAIVQKAVAEYVAKPTDPVNTNHPLFVQVDAKLKEVQADIDKRISGSFTVPEQEELKTLDLALLADFGNGQRNYEARWTNYDAAHRMLKDPTSKDLIGKNWTPLAQFQSKLAGQRQGIAALKDKLTEPFSAACKYFLDRSEEIKVSEMLRSYVVESRSKFSDNFHYPLVREEGRGEGKGVHGAESLLREWRRDLTSEAFQRATPFPDKEKLQNFLTALGQISLANTTTNGSVTVTVLDYSQSPNKAGVSHFRKGALHGREFDTSTESASESYSYNGTFTLELFDYSVTPRKQASVSRRISDLLRETKGGGRTEISVDGFPIYIVVKPNGPPPPEPSSLPDKSRILATLN